MIRNKRIFLFGSEGFIGGHVYRRINSRYHVVVPRQADLDLLDKEGLKKSIHPDDIVINAAGYADATDQSYQGQQLFKKSNVEGVRNLVEACEVAKVRQLIHISSVAAMGRWAGEMIDEGMMRRPATPYGLSKAESEMILQAFMKRVPITILRPTSVFGEGRGLAKTLCQLINNGIVPLPMGGKALVPFTYIGNVAKCVELSLDNSQCFNRTFIVGDEESYPLKDIIKCLAAGLMRRPLIIPVPGPVAYIIACIFEASARMLEIRPILDRNRLDTLCVSVTYSIRAFKEATGYVPEISMPEAAKKIGEWYRNQSIIGKTQ